MLPGVNLQLFGGLEPPVAVAELAHERVAVLQLKECKKNMDYIL